MRDRTLEDTFYIAFTTRAFATGVPTALAGTPIVSAYEDASLTQITAGITLGVDHDSVSGLNMLTIVATAANGYESGKDYNLVITTGTVSGVSVVGEVIGQFSLSLSAAAVDLANGTDGLGALKTGIDGVPTTAEFNARTLLAASYFDPATDAVANVTLVGTTTTLTNLPAITANWLTATGIAATALNGKGDWNTVVPDAAGVAPTAIENRQEMDTNSTQLAAIVLDTNDLQINQGNWLTATGFNTIAPDNAGITANGVAIGALNNITAASVLAAGDADGFSLEESLKLLLAASTGVLAGAATSSITIQAADGSKTRITATVDVDGNRSVVVRDAAG